jgi:hypothetical protein
VEILGHIFEQSISDLEEMQERIAGRVSQTKPKGQKKNSRKESGAFYAPAFITRYIVAQTLGPVVAAPSNSTAPARKPRRARTSKKSSPIRPCPIRPS